MGLHEMKIPSFEGWYFRFVNELISVAVIIGIAKTKEKQEAFIQVFHTKSNQMEKAIFDIEDLQYQNKPFRIALKQNILSEDMIHLEDPRLSIALHLHIDQAVPISKTAYAPTIMGPFAYLNHMQCNHAIINLGSQTTGTIEIENQPYLVEGIAYQEKDWGTSFPSRYIWTQSNCCRDSSSVLFLSCATIPLKLISFTGIIMVIKTDDQEYHFASYYGAIITERKTTEDGYSLIIKQGKYKVKCCLSMKAGYILEAPEQGLMKRTVEECLMGEATIELYRSNQCIHRLFFDHCGIENDHFFESK